MDRDDIGRIVCEVRVDGCGLYSVFLPPEYGFAYSEGVSKGAALLQVMDAIKLAESAEPGED